MHPILIRIGGLVIHTYGIFVAAGFLLGVAVARIQAGRENVPPQVITDIAIFGLIAAVAGARLAYIVVEWRYFTENPLELLAFWKGGLVFYGGLLAGLATAVLYINAKRLSVMKTLDAIAPGMAAGHAVGRIGCFFAGCCYGKPTHVPWAVVFTDPESLAPIGVPIHPTQLYSSANEFIIFLILRWISKRKAFDGEVAWSYLLMYSVTRFIIEYFRGDPRGSVFGGLFSTSQFIGIFSAALAFIMLIVCSSKPKRDA